MKILDSLADSLVQSARYIMALCGGTLIFLALLNVTQAWPKGKFQTKQCAGQHCLLTIYPLFIRSLRMGLVPISDGNGYHLGASALAQRRREPALQRILSEHRGRWRVALA